MIKKILALFVAFAFCSGASYIGNEQKYFFSSAALIEALQNNVNDEQKRADAATKYNELMNQQTGMVSIDNLFAICRAAGFNTYKKDGFNSCKQFINALIELDEDALSGFCPGLDAKGNNPNGLKSITDKTRIGDFCSSTNIYAGEVVFKKGYNCTCLSYACNDGYEFKGGACVTMIADGQGFCLRSDNKIQKDMSVEEAKAFCENLAIKNNCKYKSAVIKHKELRVLCNATNDEVDNAKQLMFENNEKIKANMKYFEVCDDDKGKSGGKEYCVKGVFNWVNIGQKEAIGLAQEYAKVKNGHNIICAEGYRTSWNDDYIKCATTDKKNFYEFQFDDVVESFDSDKSVGIIKGLAIIYGANSSNAQLTGNCDTTVNAKVVSSAKNYGLKSKTQNGMCRFSYDKLSEEKLATIDGLDNRIFYDDVQVQGSQQIEEYLKKYIRNQGITIKSFVCDKGYKKMDKAIMFGLKETDDILHCVLNGQPIDWVFDDLSELATERREAGHAGINCKISGGLYAGKKCHGLSKKQCDDMDARLKEINPGSAGTQWQDEQCVLVDVQQQNYIENGIQIGLSVIALADCATTIVGNAQGIMGCTLAVVEITGLATELTTGNAMQNRAQEFLAQSVKCKEHSCALTTIRDLSSKVVSIQDALKSASTVNAIDSEMARLIDLLEPEDLKSECAGDCDYKELISALGGDPSDASGTALKVANKVGFIAQFASLGASAFRLTGKAIAKLGLKATKTIDTAGDVTRAVSNTARATNTADDVSDAARFVTTATIGSADDMSDAVKATAISRADAKSLQDIAEREAKLQKGTKLSSTDIYERQRIYKLYGSSFGNSEKVEDAARAVMVTERTEKEITEAQKALAKAQDNLKYAREHPGNISRTELADRVRKVEELEKRLSDMGVPYTKMDDGVADVASGASRTGNKAADVAQTATVAANKTDDVADATRAVGKVDDIAKTEKEATDAMAFVDANRLRNGKLNADELNRLRKYYPDLSDAELQAKAKSISKELDKQRMLHGGMTDAEVRAMEEVQRAANGGMTSVEKATKEYKAALKLGSENVRLSDGWVYILKSGYTDDMVDAAGLKFHLNVAPDDVERVAPIIQRIVSKYDIPQWKFSQTAKDLVGTAEEGKQFTLYMGKSISKNETLLKQLASEIDQTLGANGIRTGRVGENLATGDRLVPGSKFVHYRYDRVDDMGNIAGYNNSYKFVVPKTGDVIKGTTKRIDNVADAARTVNKADDIATLRKTASANFDTYLAEAKNSTVGRSTHKIPKSRLNDAGWTEINKSLAGENIQLVDTGDGYMQFVRADHLDDVADAARAVRKIDDIFPDHVNFGDQGFYMSRGLMSEDEALRIAETMNKSDGVIAQAVPVEGTAGGRYKVISITESDAEKLGAEIFSGLDEEGNVIKSVFRNIDNTDFLRKLDLYRTTEITRIGNTPVFIEDVGSISGRGIVTVRVGEKKIPFYVSSGQAGKVDVPTGKWEVFWGIGEKGWFNKGNVAQINSHYGSSELRQIAAELDAKLGDPRNIEDVMATAGRKLFNGQGIVATADIGNISREQINSGLKYTPASTAKSVMTGRDANIQDVVSYLRKLH